MTTSRKAKEQARASAPGEQALEVNELIWDLGRAYYAYVGLVERVLVEHQLDRLLRPGMGLILFALFEQDGRTIKELAARSQLACSTLTGLLKRMEKAGLLVRTRDSEDARLVRVNLTQIGRELEPKCRVMARRMAEIARGGVGSQNISQAKSLLQGLTAAFRAEEQRLAAEQSPSRADD